VDAFQATLLLTEGLCSISKLFILSAGLAVGGRFFRVGDVKKYTSGQVSNLPYEHLVANEAYLPSVDGFPGWVM
jgi:hypothetical protein